MAAPKGSPADARQLERRRTLAERPAPTPERDTTGHFPAAARRRPAPVPRQIIPKVAGASGLFFACLKWVNAPSTAVGTMKRGFSIYCDLLRFGAASVVFLAHLSWQRLSGGMLYPLLPYGHPAVIVFFVLSGFVIGYVSHEKETTLKNYAAARLARLYSVVLPAIVLTFVLDRVGIMIHPQIYVLGQEAQPALRMLLGATFLSQSWFGDWALLSNGAYWSLPYEFWYYAIFGAAVYLPGRRGRIAACLCALIAGPDILLLFPLWLFGVAAYRLSKGDALRRHALPAFVATAAAGAGVFLMRGTFVHLPIPSRYLPDGFRVEDFALGLAVAANLLAASRLDFSFGRTGAWITRAAGMTFSLYLFHLPLLYFVAAIEPVAWSPYLRGTLMLLGVPPVIWWLSQMTEMRKGALRSRIAALLDRLPAMTPGLPLETRPGLGESADGG